MITRYRRLPRLRSLIRFRLVDVIGYSDELRVREVVGEGLAAGGGPGCGARLVMLVSKRSLEMEYIVLSWGLWGNALEGVIVFTFQALLKGTT